MTPGTVAATVALPALQAEGASLELGHLLLLGALALLVLLLLAAPVLLGVMALLMARHVKGQAAWRRRAAEHPEPWLLRDDWAAGRARSAPSGRWTLFVLAAGYTGVVVIVGGFLLLAGASPFMKLGLGALALGVPLTWFVAIYSALQRRKYGGSELVLDDVPFEPGGVLRATARLPGAVARAAAFQLTVRCVRRARMPARRGTTVVRTVLWDDSREVSPAAATIAGVEVPLDVALPEDQPATTLHVPNERILWEVVLSADVPGIDFGAVYEVPVFARGAPPAEAPEPAPPGATPA